MSTCISDIDMAETLEELNVKYLDLHNEAMSLYDDADSFWWWWTPKNTKLYRDARRVSRKADRIEIDIRILEILAR